MKLLNQKNEIPTNKIQNYSNFNLTTTLILKSKKRFKSLWTQAAKDLIKHKRTKYSKFQTKACKVFIIIFINS